ncbi:Rv3654c family TadE-like protein [Corynebacterium lubricantis]|uniref:Rv3654c family TadE-like protein n=1 Tax=Corynebacterium lubricantis TaxID=541095 RepID=UPI000372ACC1|nr:Rv3654c family TadE-like protein [Corynebacterium lubricantis]
MKSPLLDDRGYATIASVGIIAALATLLIAIAGIAQHTITAHRVRTVADLAAIAAATALYEGFDPCSTAGQTAELNAATAIGCRSEESDVVVTVRLGRAESQSRAGPL